MWLSGRAWLMCNVQGLSPSTAIKPFLKEIRLISVISATVSPLPPNKMGDVGVFISSSRCIPARTEATGQASGTPAVCYETGALIA